MLGFFILCVQDHLLKEFCDYAVRARKTIKVFSCKKFVLVGVLFYRIIVAKLPCVILTVQAKARLTKDVRIKKAGVNRKVFVSVVGRFCTCVVFSALVGFLLNMCRNKISR